MTFRFEMNKEKIMFKPIIPQVLEEDKLERAKNKLWWDSVSSEVKHELYDLNYTDEWFLCAGLIPLEVKQRLIKDVVEFSEKGMGKFVSGVDDEDIKKRVSELKQLMFGRNFLP